MKVLVTLGYFDDTGECALAEVDLARGDSRIARRFEPPSSLVVPDKGFTGATWTGAPRQSELVVCAFNALHRFDGQTLQLRGTLHQPDMNDLHAVCCDDGRLLVANTGLDAIDVYTIDGRYMGGYRSEPSWLLAERWAGRTPSRADHERMLAGGWDGAAIAFEDSAPLDRYYSTDGGLPIVRRKLRDYVHPNHVAVVGHQVLVTRLADRRVVDVNGFKEVLQAPAPPHDGELDGDRFWLTCVDGRVLSYAIDRAGVTSRVTTEVDASVQSGCYGWCRGLLVTEEHLVVGFTAIRRVPQYPWRHHPFEDTTTEVVVLDKRTLRLVTRVAIGPSDRHAKIFDIVRWE